MARKLGDSCSSISSRHCQTQKVILHGRLVLSLPASHEFCTLGLLNFHTHRSKITIQQLYSPLLKKKKFIVQCPGKADTRTVSPTALAITMGGGNSVWSNPESPLKKKKRFHPSWGLKNFFSKTTTPREQKLHFGHMLGVGIRSRDFLKRTNYGGVLQFWRHPGFLLPNCDGHFIVKKKGGGGRGAGRGSAGGRSKVTLKGTAAAAASCMSSLRAANNLLRAEQLQQPLGAARHDCYGRACSSRFSTTEREGRRILP